MFNCLRGLDGFFFCCFCGFLLAGVGGGYWLSVMCVNVFGGEYCKMFKLLNPSRPPKVPQVHVFTGEKGDF